MGMTTCGNCGGMIGAMQAPHQWDDALVCDPCYAKLREERARRNAPAAGVASKRRAGSGHKLVGALLAGIGAIVAAIGWKMFSDVGERMGMDQGGAKLTFTLGIVIACVGLLWFALGRVLAK